MNALRIRKWIDSETLHLPELKGMMGREVEIIVLDEAEMPNPVGTASPYDAFFRLAGKDVVDPEAYKQLRAASLI
ncbi:MAG: hypothetical protein ACLQNE_07195 [Thermoguttaceae bacterium]|jgi:hypothetical protein